MIEENEVISPKSEDELLMELFKLSREWLSTYNELKELTGDTPMTLFKEMINEKLP